MKHLIFFILMLNALALPGYAQRTSKGQGFVDAGATWPLGASLAYGQYTLSGYWDAGVRSVSHWTTLVTDDRLDYLPVRACGGYHYRLVSTRSRSFNVYGGGEAFVGAELVDPFGKLPESFELDVKPSTFVVGVVPEVNAELFLSGGFALSGFCSLAWAFNSPVRAFSLEGGLKLRFLL